MCGSCQLNLAISEMSLLKITKKESSQGWFIRLQQMANANYYCWFKILPIFKY